MPLLVLAAATDLRHARRPHEAARQQAAASPYICLYLLHLPYISPMRPRASRPLHLPISAASPLYLPYEAARHQAAYALT